MAIVLLDIPQFRLDIPEFSDDTEYPDATIQNNWDIGTCYISDVVGQFLKERCRQIALEYMAAHLLKIADNISNNIAPYQLASASEDGVSTSFAAPPNSNEWQWWLNQTPYGQSLYTLLSINSVGGFYLGGLPEQAAFRKVGGIFSGGFF